MTWLIWWSTALAGGWTSALCHLDEEAARAQAETAAQRAWTDQVFSSAADLDALSALDAADVPDAPPWLARGQSAALTASGRGAADDPNVALRAPWPPPPDPVERPLKQTPQGMAVQLQVHGREAWMLLDSGAEANVITRSFTTDASSGDVLVKNHAGATASGGTARVDVDTYGGGSTSHTFLVLDDEALAGRDIDGILGMPVFAGMRVELDLDANVARFTESSGGPPNSVWWSGKMYQDATIGTERGLVYWDTGAATDLCDQVRAHALPLPRTKRVKQRFLFLGEIRKLQLEQLREPLAMEVAGAEFVLQQGLLWPSEQDALCADARVGIDHFDGKTVIFDGPARQIQIAP